MGDPPGPVSRNPLACSNPLAPIYVCVFLFSAGEAMLHVLVPPYLAIELGVGPGVVGAVLGVFAVAALVARLPVGAIYTSRRARKLLLLGGGLSALAFAVVPLVRGVYWFGALMAVDGLGWSIATTAQLAALAAARPPGLSTAWAMGWYSGFIGLGHTVAGATAGFLADTFGFTPSFFALAAVVAVATFVIVAALGRLDPSGAGNATAAKRPRVRLRETLGHVAEMPAVVWAGVLIMIYINLVNGVFNSFHPLLVLPAGLSLTQIGVLNTCRAWGSSTVRLGSGLVFSRTDGRWMTTPLLLLGAASLFLLPAVRSSFPLQVPLFLAVGVSRGLLRVTGSAEAFDGVGEDERKHGMTAALLHAGLDFGKLIGPLTGGVLGEAFGLAAMFRLIPVLLLAAYLPLDLAARRSIAARRANSSEGRPSATKNPSEAN
jgi:predicted MFS family arabinose efflux permease